LITLGCPKNQVDSEVLAGELTRGGAILTRDAGAADTILINTCAFTADAKQESINAILEAVRLRDGAKKPRVAVWGCLPARYSSALAKEMPEVDRFFGVEPFKALGRYILGPRYCWSERAFHGRIASTAGHTAYLKISEGCDHRCTFCAIPLFKGRARSRTLRSLAAEAEALADRGVKELVLVAQDTTAYGRDLEGSPGLPGLIRRLARIRGIAWIRILYGHPAHVDDALIECMASEPKVCRALDIPLQHISDPVLAAMGRRTSAASIRRLVEKLRTRIPGIVLRTTFITGFPGETEARFEELVRFVRDTRFERLGAFAYSPEEGTRAFRLAGRAPKAVAERRRTRLLREQRGIAARINRALESRILDVLVDGFDREQHLHFGRTQGDAPEVDQTVWIRGRAAAGRFIRVSIEGSSAYDLIGRAVESDGGCAESLRSFRSKK
jgi:ribosomal protein S12 methylthiotransferase